MVCVYQSPFTVFRKQAKTFLGVGVYSLFCQTPVVNGSLLLDELVEQPAQDQATDHEPRESECGSVLRPRDSDRRARQAMMAQEVCQDAQRADRCQYDDQPLAHVRIRLSCFRRSVVREWEPAFRTLPALACVSHLACYRSVRRCFRFSAAVNGSGASRSRSRAQPGMQFALFTFRAMPRSRSRLGPGTVVACGSHIANAVPTTFPYIHLHINHPAVVCLSWLRCSGKCGRVKNGALRPHLYGS